MTNQNIQTASYAREKAIVDPKDRHVTSTIATSVMNGINKGIPKFVVEHVRKCSDVCQKRDVFAVENDKARF